MRRRQIDIPVLNQTGTTAGIPHWFGGMRFYWTEEAAEKTASDPSFRKATLTAYKLIGYTYASDELVGDSAISLSDFLAGPLGMSGGIGWMEDYAFLRGTGVGQPLGVINAGATISVAATASPPAPGTLYTDLVNMMESFLPTGRGVWVINQRHMSDLLTMNGPSANPYYLWGNAVQGQANTLLGWPVIWTEKLPAPGTAGSILLADFRYYLLGDRQATTIESTQYDRWKYDETSWRAVHRVDGQPWLSAPLTLADGTAQVSPFVILGAKST
jgi:HK97 family phage major capsid protein